MVSIHSLTSTCSATETTWQTKKPKNIYKLVVMGFLLLNVRVIRNIIFEVGTIKLNKEQKFNAVFSQNCEKFVYIFLK